MGWVESKSVRLILPAFADEFVNGKSAEGLESLGEVIGGDEVAEVSSQLIVAVVVVALDSGLLDGPVHALDLAVDPGMIRFGKPVIDAMRKTDPVKGMSAKARRWPFAVLGKVGELDSVIGEHGMDAIGDLFDKGLKEGCDGPHVGPFHQLDHDELRGTIDGHDEIEPAFGGAHFSQIDVEVADRIPLELLPCGLVALGLRQSANAMAQKTAMQRGTRQLRNGGLEGIQAIVQRQQGVHAKGHADGFLFAPKAPWNAALSVRWEDRSPSYASSTWLLSSG